VFALPLQDQTRIPNQSTSEEEEQTRGFPMRGSTGMVSIRTAS
jgi:hypothetical protein